MPHRLLGASSPIMVVGNKSEQTMGYGNAVSSNVPQWLGGIVVFMLGAVA